VSCGVAIATHNLLSKANKLKSNCEAIQYSQIETLYLREIDVAGAKLIVMYTHPTDIEFLALRRNLNNSSNNGGFRGGDFSVRSGG